MDNPNPPANQRHGDQSHGDQSQGSFASRLKEARLAAGLTQRDIAFALGIKQARYAKYEAGRSEAPYEVLIKIVRLTNLSLDHLIAGQPNRAAANEEALEPMLRELLDVIPIPAVIYDENSRLVGHNRAYQDVFFGDHPRVIRPGTPHETVLRTWAYSKGYGDLETEAFLRQRLSRPQGANAIQEVRLGSQRVRFAESDYGPYTLVLFMEVTEVSLSA